MYKLSASFKLSCILEKDNDNTYIKLCILDKKHNIINTLEFADITNLMDELRIANDTLNIYSDFKDLEKAIISGALNRFIGRFKKNKKLDFLLKVHAKSLHEHNACRSYCVFCNPNSPKDFFPDFTSEVRDYSENIKM